MRSYQTSPGNDEGIANRRGPGHTFDRIANAIAKGMGHPMAFITAAGLVILWGVSGPIFHFSNTWQLIINTGTTVLTFLMVFVIQNSVNRDSAAVQVKLDELIRVNAEARDALIGVEHEDEKDIRDAEHGIEVLSGDKRVS